MDQKRDDRTPPPHTRVNGVGRHNNNNATYEGHEVVNQSDTVSIPAVAPGHCIPMRVIVCFFPHHDMFSCLFAFMFLMWNTHVCVLSGLARKWFFS